MIKIKFFPVGLVAANCYIIYNEDKALIIDPGGEAEKIKNEIESLNLEPIAILLTHTHFDHIGAVQEIRTAYDVPVYVHPEEQDWLQNAERNLSHMLPHPITTEPADYLFEDYKDYSLDLFNFKVVPTPGHSPGGVSFIFEKEGFVLTGDSLFNGSIGRTDLYRSDHTVLLDSIQKNIFTLDNDMDAYPGHGDPTSIGHEKQSNPFFQ